MLNHRHGKLSVLGSCVVGILAAAAASAQQAPQGGAEELEMIVVTGSRIQRAGFDTLEPATVVSSAYIDERGLTNVADALKGLPGFGTPVGPEGAQASYGVAVNFANRFGLGSNRTLTLVNGRRFVSSNPPTIFGPGAPGVQVDLNVVPTSMVERVENLAIGGAPTYGSDAIAGVVNVILRRDYEGLEFGGNYGITDKGDNERQNVYVLWGTNFGADDRGNFTINASYDNVDGVLLKDRSYFQQRQFFTTNPLASTMAAVFPGRTAATDGRYNTDIPYNTGSADGIPNSVLILNRRIWTTPFGGLISPTTGPFRPGSANLIPNGFGPNGNVVLGFDRNGNLVPYSPGSTFTAVDASGGDGLDLLQASQITSDLERVTVYSTARWGITDNVDIFFEGSYYDADSTELSDQWMYNSPLFSGLSNMIRFPATYPMLTAQAQQTLAGLGVTSFNLSKTSRDLVTNNASGNTTTARVVLGLDGDFELWSRKFNWETYANWGKTEAEYYSTSLNQQNFINALNVTRNAQGQVVCSSTQIAGLSIPGGSTPKADPNCVPLDMFGDGRPTAAMRDYVTESVTSQATIEQTMFNINVSSTLVDLWSGPLLYNIGYEHRKEESSFEPDPFLEAGLGRSVPITPLKGSYKTDELFGEVVVPLVDPASDWVGLKKLELIGKYRTVDNEINGRADTYTYGAMWKPFNQLELRGNFTRAIRAPAVTELFLPQATSFQFVTGDPCDSRFINTGPNPPVRQANCQAFLQYYGLTTFTSTAASASIQGISGGNPTLENEESDSVTYGFTWTPPFIEGLSIAADYYKIEIDNVITSLSAAQLASSCFDSTSFDATDVPNGNQYCSAITRNAPGSAAPGQATTFVSGYVNGQYLNFEAYSAQATYSLATDYGRWSFGYMGYFPKELISNVTGVNPDESVGEFGTAKQQHQFNVTWERDRLGLNLAANYQSGVEFNVLYTAETQDILKVDSYWLLTAGASFRFSDDLQVRGVITNLLDEKPPFPYTGTGVYDQLGRRYNVSFVWKL